jgi:hypothetical protein
MGCSSLAWKNQPEHPDYAQLWKDERAEKLFSESALADASTG